MSAFAPVSEGSRLYVASPSDAEFAGGYLLSLSERELPITITLKDAVFKYKGWFVQFPGIAKEKTSKFEEKAQVFFANPARENAFTVWFTSTDELTGSVLFAEKASDELFTVIRTFELPFGNFSVNISLGTEISFSDTAIALTPGTLAVTPTGERVPKNFPLASLSVDLLNTPEPTNVLSLDFSVNSEEASDSLDIGLRSFSAPAEGGYTQTVLYRVFNLSSDANVLRLKGTIDPLTPTDTTRSRLHLSNNDQHLETYYQSAVGVPISARPLATAGLVFTERLIAVDVNGRPVVLPGNQSLYLTPVGEFEFCVIPESATGSDERSLEAAPTMQTTLMGGLSAVEYFKNADNPVLEFVPHQDAFARTLQNGTQEQGRIFGDLSNAGKTSWATLKTATGTEYFAQPDSSILHQSQAAEADSAFLKYLPVSVGRLQDDQTRVANAGIRDLPMALFPLVPYRSIKATNISETDIGGIEMQVWSPTRRSVVQTIIQTDPHAIASSLKTSTLPSPPYSTTPQGLLLELGQGDLDFSWKQLTLAQSAAQSTPPNRSDRLFLSDVAGELKSALQTNQLFLVVTGADIISQCSSIPYSITRVRQRQLALTINDEDVNAKLEAMVPKQWPDMTALHADLAAQLTQEQLDDYFITIRNGLGDFSLFVADWEFDLSPWRWLNHNTILIFKFCNKTLSQLVDDTGQWVSVSTFNTSPDGTRQRIQQIMDISVARFESGDNDLAYFVNTVMESETWNGILALNAQVPLTGLPPQLEGLAAGIDASRFEAHHIGVSVTPVSTGQGSDAKYSSRPSSVFGLIDYEDDADLTGSDPYDFKVNSLKVGIANSEIISFSSKIELLINELFKEVSTQNASSTGNNLILYGVYQKSGNSGSYVFSTISETSYGITSQVLNTVGIRSASFVTVTDGGDVENIKTVTSTFTLTGAISFVRQKQFDLFSYGTLDQSPGNINVSGLAYSNLAIDVSFAPATPQYRDFVFNAQRILLHSSSSRVRAESLSAHFPMKLTSMVQGLGDVTPNNLAFMPVDSPLEGSELTAPWFGLNYELDLGSAGALAAKIDFTAGLLLAWAPSGAESIPKIYIGLHLPGVKGGERAIPIEGVLKLAFSDVTFLVDPPTYILKLGDIALKLLALSFPPNGQIDLLMFGNPDAQTSGALGWYASYVKNGAGDSSGKSEPRLTRLKSQSALSYLQQALLAVQGTE